MRGSCAASRSVPAGPDRPPLGSRQLPSRQCRRHTAHPAIALSLEQPVGVDAPRAVDRPTVEDDLVVSVEGLECLADRLEVARPGDPLGLERVCRQRHHELQALSALESRFQLFYRDHKSCEIGDEWTKQLVAAVCAAREEGAINATEDAEKLAFEVDSFLLLASAALVISDDSTALARARRAIDRRVAEAAPSS
jgi:hypothetical protein